MAKKRIDKRGTREPITKIKFLVEGITEKFYFKDGNINWIKKYANNIYFKYLYYWFISPIGKNQIDSYLIGSTQKALTIEAIKKLEINLPPLNTQKKIAKILSDIDSKVELNNTINNNLLL